MPAATSLDVTAIRKDFPILAQQVHGKPLIYLDNAATSQKPKCVIEALTRFYLMDNANIHRGVHQLSERSTQSYEAARGKVQRFLNAANSAGDHLRPRRDGRHQPCSADLRSNARQRWR